MAQKIIKGNEELSKKIKARRLELGFTIEEAASRAGVGSKTWYRYESGESIRADKTKGICKALNWRSLLEDVEVDTTERMEEEYKNHEAWSCILEEEYGFEAAVAFAVGSDILLDHIKEDMEELVTRPKGTHIGQLSISWLYGSLPEQFVMRYDYEFLYQMKCVLCDMRKRAKFNKSMYAHSVLEELLYYLCCEEASVLAELGDPILENANDSFGEWIYDLFGDSDMIFFLYSDIYLEKEHSYHFDNWAEQIFYVD